MDGRRSNPSQSSRHLFHPNPHTYRYVVTCSDIKPFMTGATSVRIPHLQTKSPKVFQEPSMVFNPKIKKDVNLNYVTWTRVSQSGIWTGEPSLVLVVCVSTSTVLMLPDMNSSLGLNMYFTFLDSTRVKLVKNNPKKPCQCSVPLQHPLLLPCYCRLIMFHIKEHGQSVYF